LFGFLHVIVLDTLLIMLIFLVCQKTNLHQLSSIRKKAKGLLLVSPMMLLSRLYNYLL